MSKRSVEVAPPRRTRMVIRKVGPLSVLRWSMFFYFCIFLIFFFAVWIMYGVLDSTGVLKSWADTLGSQFSLGKCVAATATTDQKCIFTFNSGWIFSRLFVAGVILVCIWSFINLLVALLYNLVSDVIGGIEITTAEKR